jgi:hypothetical protein
LRQAWIELHEFDRKAVRVLRPGLVIVVFAALGLNVQLDAMLLEVVTDLKYIIYLETYMRQALSFRMMDIITLATVE